MAKYCRNCGNELPENAYICVKCGVKVDGGSSDRVPGAKSRIAAGLLGIFLGSLGIHNFYLGYNGKAVGQLLLTILSCGLLAIVSEIWGLIEGIMILTGSISTDANGNPLTD